MKFEFAILSRASCVQGKTGYEALEKRSQGKIWESAYG